MTKKQKSIKLQHKRQRKEAKRIIKHKIVRKALNRWNGLSKPKQTLARERAKRSLMVRIGLQNLDLLVKKWSDKITDEFIKRIDELKANLKAALKTKDLEVIDPAIKAFVPIQEELNGIVAKYDK
jgi:hypothetical protein